MKCTKNSLKILLTPIILIDSLGFGEYGVKPAKSERKNEKEKQRENANEAGFQNYVWETG